MLQEMEYRVVARNLSICDRMKELMTDEEQEFVSVVRQLKPGSLTREKFEELNGIAARLERSQQRVSSGIRERKREMSCENGVG